MIPGGRDFKILLLALLDYVSRAHDIANSPSSVRPSVRPSAPRGRGGGGALNILVVMGMFRAFQQIFP